MLHACFREERHESINARDDDAAARIVNFLFYSPLGVHINLLPLLLVVRNGAYERSNITSKDGCMRGGL
jgi:hypothetical protein